ncbi:MAG: cobaltochelatase subunit CobN [Parabacteroides distasonis]
MTTPDGRLGIARLQFGNVVLMPQMAAGSGDNAFFKWCAGTNAAPPHTYIASYLWLQHGFKADAGRDPLRYAREALGSLHSAQKTGSVV